jgi:hypothetical protein
MFQYVDDLTVHYSENLVTQTADRQLEHSADIPIPSCNQMDTLNRASSSSGGESRQVPSWEGVKA